MVIPGPTGTLEASHQPAASPTGAEVVLCHPHPLYGGSMHDGVLDCAARILLAAGMGVLRFNFRGVGQSAGRFDGGRGEIDDLRAVIGWLRDRAPDAPVWLGGYSFGAHVVWQATAHATGVARILLLAPPIGAMDFPARAVAYPVDVFAGDQDSFIEAEALSAWTGVHLHVVAGADHFFSGRLNDLADRIGAAVDRRDSDDPNP
jgi:uncharacterized protein